MIGIQYVCYIVLLLSFFTIGISQAQYGFHTRYTVEPVLQSPGLSGHLCITAMFTRSQIFSHTNVCIVVCIKRSPV